MRGGTSKGLYFLAEDLPVETGARDRLLLALMGSPDPRQIDGLGGADPLTSKVAVVNASTRPDADVDYLFLQVFPDRPVVTDQQNCGNILAGVGPFAVERGLVRATAGKTVVRVYLVNSDSIAELEVDTPDGAVRYAGEARIDGVPGSHAPVIQRFIGTAGSQCGALLPSGNAVDTIDGVACTLIDNGMPVVVLPAADFGVTGEEDKAVLEGDEALRRRLEAIRLQAGPMMNLGDVAQASVPKMSLVLPPRAGGLIATRTFIPQRLHSSIGVLGAVSVANACLIDGTPAAALAAVPDGNPKLCDVEHPTGALTVELSLDAQGQVEKAGILRTARMLMDGTAMAPEGL